jgi:putative membrane protein
LARPADLRQYRRERERGPAFRHLFTNQSLKAGGDKNVATLKGLKGAAFDKAYVDNEVAYHQAVLDAVDKSLIPGASNAELKALLVKVRPAFVAHLEHAKKLQASLK